MVFWQDKQGKKRVTVSLDTAEIFPDTMRVFSDTSGVVFDTTAIFYDTLLIFPDTAVLFFEKLVVFSDTTAVFFDTLLLFPDTTTVFFDTEGVVCFTQEIKKADPFRKTVRLLLSNDYKTRSYLNVLKARLFTCSYCGELPPKTDLTYFFALMAVATRPVSSS